MRHCVPSLPHIPVVDLPAVAVFRVTKRFCIAGCRGFSRGGNPSASSRRCHACTRRCKLVSDAPFSPHPAISLSLLAGFLSRCPSR